MSETKKKIGIMGGTFDPIHYGHLILAQAACEQFSLDKVWIMPDRQPPHKAGRTISRQEHRIAMARLAAEDDPRLELSLFEMERTGNTYTCDTLRLLRERYPHTDFYFIMGGDSVVNFHTWYHPEQIASLCTILAAGRPGACEGEALLRAVEHLRQAYGGKAYCLTVPSMDISSQMLRQLVEEGRSIRYYVPDPVRNYIARSGLYRG